MKTRYKRTKNNLQIKLLAIKRKSKEKELYLKSIIEQFMKDAKKYVTRAAEQKYSLLLKISDDLILIIKKN